MKLVLVLATFVVLESQEFFYKLFSTFSFFHFLGALVLGLGLMGETPLLPPSTTTTQETRKERCGVVTVMQF